MCVGVGCNSWEVGMQCRWEKKLGLGIRVAIGVRVRIRRTGREVSEKKRKK